MPKPRLRRAAQPLPAADVSRREALELVALACAAPAALLLKHEPARAQSKAPKATVKYQPMPMNGQQCSSCLHFTPGAQAGDPGSCAVVAGEIAPEGWCSVYAAKP